MGDAGFNSFLGIQFHAPLTRANYYRRVYRLAMAKRKADNFIASDDEDNGDFDETGQSAQSEQDEKPKSRKVCSRL